MARATRNKYQLPIAIDKLISIDTYSSPAHSGKRENAIDFENTIVLAAAPGTVTYVKDDSDIGGPSVSFCTYSNFLSIKHQNEEYTRYDHLAFGSSKVKVGEFVSAGQEIAKVGLLTCRTFISKSLFSPVQIYGKTIGR